MFIPMIARRMSTHRISPLPLFNRRSSNAAAKSTGSSIAIATKNRRRSRSGLSLILPRF